MRIEYIADHPELLPMIASWLFEEWWRVNPDNSIDIVEGRLREAMNRDKLPLTLIAFSDSTPVGAASLIHYDMESRKDLSPWLAAVYVLPEHRGKGVGSQLVHTAVEKAQELGVGTLNLFTSKQEKLYTRLGWSVLERKDNGKEKITIMSIQRKV